MTAVVVEPGAAGGEGAEAADLAGVVQRMAVVVERAAGEVDGARVGRRPAVTRILLLAPLRMSPPAGFESAPPRTSVPPMGSMVPVLEIALPMLPKPWIVPGLAIAPPARSSVMPFNSIKPLLLKG